MRKLKDDDIVGGPVKGCLPPVVENNTIRRPYQAGGFYSQGIVRAEQGNPASLAQDKLATVGYGEGGTVVGNHVNGPTLSQTGP